MRRRLSFGFALLVLLPVTAVGEAPSEKKPICVTDRVEGVFTRGGNAVLIGWAVDPTQGSVAKVEIAAPAGPVAEVARWGEWRPDVMAHYARPDYLWSGWTSTVSFEGASPGRYPVEVFAVGRDGSRTSCGQKVLVVRDGPTPVRRPAWKIGLQVLSRTAIFLAWLAFVGWAVAALFRLRPVVLAAPLVGLTLFAVVAEAGGALHIRPIHSAAALTVAMGLGLLLPGARRVRSLLPRRSWGAAIAAATIFALVGVVPLASHGEGAVLGDIDDGVRECTVADSISRYGWNVPNGMLGYFAVIRGGWNAGHMRNGDVYLLSALADAFGERSHAVHSVAMLGAGCLVVLAAGLLAFRVLRASPRMRWIPPVFVALNATLIATLYNQHLGSLLAAGLLALFLASTFPLLLSPRSSALVPAALFLAAGLSIYPESLPSWAVAAAVSLLMVRSLRRRWRAIARFGLAVLLAALLNPIALLRVARSWLAVSAEPTLSYSYSRMVVGDTHYFPSLLVVPGLEAYRIDAPAPVGGLRSRLILLATAAIITVILLGWLRLSSRRRWLALTLLLPLALAFWANFHLDFPYGFAKFLPAAVPLWAVAFALFASALAGGTRPSSRAPLRVLAGGTVALVLLLEIPSTRHVVRHAIRAVPSYDPAFRSLPALARIVGRNAAIRIDDYPLAGEHWIYYFLGENPVDLDPAPDRYPNAPRFRIAHRWGTSEPPGKGLASTRDFSIVPIPAAR